ncbi:CFS1-like protein [Punctularia strigosozonata HHB-11173 SS5]|uniref:CFS1-like protein n=1 Tax=Punctularia strigosozonata (strain HHB-11173) TaxID=741275 RepID=UPI000441844D|nr:CFS1-like protein [Punctularia strigosozonata HHB-11173 SS5]EIN13000.1 CFS1-like protein [Punctularia strigosozonata HHB-11173 SS5]
MTVAPAAPRGLTSWFRSYARSYILSVLAQGIQIGQLEIHDGDQSYVFGKPSETIPVAQISVCSEKFWSRLFLSNDLGFAESYMLGEIETEDLRLICDLWIYNAPNLGGLATTFYNAFATGYKFWSGLFGQSPSRSRLNAVAGYDGSNSMFKAFLSEEMMYSCALWSDEEGGINGDLTDDRKSSDLEAAQRRKIQHVIAKAGIKKGDRVLEFGSGWCGLAIEAVRTTGCTVDTLTLSVEQKKLGEERIREAGLEGSIRVHLMDYRKLPPHFEKAFDAFVSIEMIEHVGTRHYKDYFSMVDWALKPRNATAVVTSSTLPEARYTEFQNPDFSRYYMWPNGALPSATALVNAANSATSGRLQLEAVENHGPHYARTLREWNRRFRLNVPSIEQDIIDGHPEFKGHPQVLEAFKRKWLYLFPSAESGFANGYLSCHMLVFARDMNTRC